MYFEIENTPERLREARKKEIVNKSSIEECPRLILAPFFKPPQVVFDNALIGRTCEKVLEVFNPTKYVQQIRLGKAVPPGLVIHLPGEYLEVEPDTCYSLTMTWTPLQPTALRETIRFTNDDRGRYDVFVVLKSVTNIKGKNNQPKFKTSPGKMKKKKSGKKSPVAIYKKRVETIYNTTKVKKSIHVFESQQYLHTMNNDLSSYDYSIDSNAKKCPFDSPNSADLNFNTTEIFSNMQRNKVDMLHQTYDKTYSTEGSNNTNIPNNILKPSNNQQIDNSASDVFDNLTFTPLKSLPSKNDKLDKGPQIILSMNSDSEFDDSLNMKSSNKENETHSIICITSSQQPSTWLKVNHQYENIQCNETPTLPNKKIPNTSSPKDFNSPNFSINTDFSRISELSFFPSRCSTERKMLPKFNSDTHEIIDDSNVRLSNTYTKESPSTPFEYQVNQIYMDSKQPYSITNQQNPKMCRQSLFKDYQRELSERNYLARPDNLWHNDLRSDRSPPRSLTPPPLQSIPEESIQSETQPFDKSDRQMATFTIDRTFDKTGHQSVNRQSTWSKKAFRVEPMLWKMPAPVGKKSLKPKVSKGNQTFETNKSISPSQNMSISHVGNVYSQSLTVDPFLSTTYFYDEGAVEKFEKEFKRWLNCILTPPADLDSNVEQKIDVGKAWMENRNKEIPAAPTREQVCSLYHNSHRLESLRKSARALLISPEISQVFIKLNMQIEKKLIAIRNDRNLHLDVGLQKIVMEVLLSYNPLWLRVGLEAIYGLVIPLKSNSDIEGLTTFIVQRMFKNPNLKNKNSKSRAPNMLLPAYMDAIKKYTLKKFFMLVFFLDQAKQKKIISHDPCLFCRNAICKESREIVIRFTRELIAGIGDITKHLRPLGYVVSHKQSFLDEYKYAVHNIAIDIRDGVRLTKVMEIILMKNGLLHQLRTPAISRLQKIHNVQVALNALKEADFVIVGDITATDIADGHREKTLSLLWQLIHVFRAPLFEKAANVIQTWWKKKYEVIAENKREEERVLAERNHSASIIQYWWRKIKYNRMVEYKMYQVTMATLVIQKYCRMWLCRSRMKTYKLSAVKIAEWYKSKKIIRQSKQRLLELRQQREELRRKSAIIIQVYIRRWLCIKKYEETRAKIILIQKTIRRFLVQKWYIRLKKTANYVQERFRGKLLMRKEINNLAQKKRSAIIIQSQFRMLQQRRHFNKVKTAVIKIEVFYTTLMLMRIQREQYLRLKYFVIKIQSNYRCRKSQEKYMHQRNLIILLQRKFRANRAMKQERHNFLQIKTAAIVLQNSLKSYLKMKQTKTQYNTLRSSTIFIQRVFRSYLQMKSDKRDYLLLRKSTIVLQIQYRSLLAMRRDRTAFLKLKDATLVIQTKYRALVLMREVKKSYKGLKNAAIVIQTRYKALILMRTEKAKYDRLKLSCKTIQNAYRAYLLGKQERQIYLDKKKSAIKIQNWYRSQTKGYEVRKQFEEYKKASLVIQNGFRAYILAKKQRQIYIKIKTAATCIQKYYRMHLLTKTIRKEFIELKTSTIKIQRYYRSYLETKKQREVYLITKKAAQTIQVYYRRYVESRIIRNNYCELRSATICIQQRYRDLLSMRQARDVYLRTKHSTLVIQRNYRALLAMRKARDAYIQQRSAIICLQQRYRAQSLMKREKHRYTSMKKACIIIQTHLRSYKAGVEQRNRYLLLKQATIHIQQRYRALLIMRRNRKTYLDVRSAVIVIQRKFRANQMMLEEKNKYTKTLQACISIQRYYRSCVLKRKQRQCFMKLKNAVILIQVRYRELRKYRSVRSQFIAIRRSAILIQRRIRFKYHVRELARKEAVDKIQTWYLSIKMRNKCRNHFINIKQKIILIQSLFKMYSARKIYLATQTAAIKIQRYYLYYKLAIKERENYVKIKMSVTKMQACIRCFIERKHYLRLRSAVLIIQAVYRLKKQRALVQKQREDAAICIQKNVRRYLTQAWFKRYIKHVTFIQKLWRGIIVTRLVRGDFLQKKLLITKIQALARGYIVRKEVENKREEMEKLREEQRRNWAASKIQALFRGNAARLRGDSRARVLRMRWRTGGLLSTQKSLRERNEEAMDVLRNMSDIETVIRAFRTLEVLTETLPMTYDSKAASIVRRVYVYMSVTNRSISSVEVLKYASSVLVNLARYRITGPKIYARDRIFPVLKFMWRFSNSETSLFCILSTYLWLFSKYEEVKKDLTEFLHTAENHRILITIKGNVNRMKRMTNNSRHKFSTPQPIKFISHTMNSSVRCSLNASHNFASYLLPALEPDYGITRADKPRYFEDAEHAISCLFEAYKL